MKLVEELGISELTTEQIEVLCSNAEDAARKYVLSKVALKMVERLDISVDAEGLKPLNLTIDVHVALLRQIDVDLKEVVDEAAIEALKASEEYMRKLK